MTQTPTVFRFKFKDTKHPDEAMLPYTIDFNKWLGTTDNTVASLNVESDDVTVETFGHIDGIVTMKLSGGKASAVHLAGIKATVTTPAGRILICEAGLEIAR